MLHESLADTPPVAPRQATASRLPGRGARRALALTLIATILGMVLPGLTPAAAAQDVSGVSVSLTPSTSGAADATYTVGMTAAAALTVGEAVYLLAPSGTVFPGFTTDVSLNGSVASGVRVTGGDLLEVDSPVAVAGNGSVSVVIHGVTNPSLGTYALAAYTSADTTPASSSSYTIVAPVVITTSALPAATLGQSYPSTTLQATGGFLNCGGCYDWYATGLPSGMFVDTGSGNLSGTPSQGGTFNVAVTAEDAANPPNSASKTLTLTVNSALTGVSASVSPDTADATNTQYTVGFTATSGLTVGQAVYITAPSGTVFPSSASEYTINGATASSVLGGGSEAVQLTASAPVTAGTTVSAVVYGVTNPAGGSYTLSVATSADTTPVRSPSYTIVAPLSITTSSLPTGTLGQPYPSTTLAATGGVLVAPCDCYQNWQATGLPSGLSIDPGSGIIGGTPSQSGVFNVTVSAEDQATPPNSTSTTLTLTVRSAVTSVTAAVYPDTAGAADAQYTVSFTATSGLTVGQAVYITAPSGTAFPSSASDYTINGATASSVLGGGSDAVQVLASAPVSAGATVSAVVYAVANPVPTDTTGYTVTVWTSADAAPTQSTNYTIVTPLAIATTSLAGAIAGQPYNVTLQAIGGILVGPCDCYQNWQATGLPPGLSIDPGSGIINGTPTATGTFSVTVSVQDQATSPDRASATLTLTVSPAGTTPLAVFTASLPLGGAGLAYNATLAATGGSSPYTWRVASGTLPAGIQLSSAGALSGQPTTAGAYTFTVQVTDSSGATATSATLTLDVAGAASVPVPVSVPPPSVKAGVVVRAVPSIVPVGSVVLIQAVVGSTGGQPLAGTTVTLSTTGGQLSATSAVTNGAGIVAVFLTDLRAETDTVTASANGAGGSTVATFQTPLPPPPPAHGSVNTSALTTEGGNGAAQLATQSGTFAVVAATTSGGSSLSLTIGGSEASQAIGSVSAAVYTSSSAESLLSSENDVQISSTSSSTTTSNAVFLGPVVSFGTTNSALNTTLFNDQNSNAQEGLQVTVPFDPSALTGLGPNASPELVWLDTSQNPPLWTNQGVVILNVDAAVGTITALLPHLSVWTVVGAVQAATSTQSSAPAPTYGSASSSGSATTSKPSVPFSDVPSGYWAYQAIATLVQKGIISGFPDGTFQPDANVTRAQFIKMLDLVVGLKPGSGPSTFGDVAPSAWYSPYVAAAVQSGFVQGVSPTRFAPDAIITREQMAVLLARALRLTHTQPLTFSDAASIDSWAVSGVEAAVAAGYLSGFPDGTFQPLAAATRAQAAEVLAKVLASADQG